MPVIAYIDAEVEPKHGKVLDIGIVRSDGPEYHGHSAKEFGRILSGADYVCGHNAVNHDMKYLEKEFPVIGLYRRIQGVFPCRRLCRSQETKRQWSDIQNFPIKSRCEGYRTTMFF